MFVSSHPGEEHTADKGTLGARQPGEVHAFRYTRFGVRQSFAEASRYLN